jgi:alpha-L-rhamnosidase
MKHSAAIFSATLLLLGGFSPMAQANVSVTSLRCEDRIAPLGIDVQQPRFSWKIESDQRGENQTAYQIVVDGQWDSGKVLSSQSIQLEYAGPALAPAKDYSWKVRVWDSAGNPSAYSDIAKFSTGLGSWNAKWIGRDELENAQFFGAAQWIWFPEGNPATSAPVAQRFFKKDFTLAANPLRATVSVTADDGFDVFINGTKVGTGDSFSRPGEFEISALLHSGANTIAITANNVGTAANPAGLVARLSVRFSAGSDFELLTNSSWSASTNGTAWTAAQAMGAYGMAPWGTMNVRQLPARHLRKDFNADPAKQVARATAYVCGFGFFDLFLNGQEVSDHVMDPAISDYTKALYYVTFDVTGQINPDANAIGLMLGNGRFFAPRFKDPAPTQTFGFPKAMVQLEIEYTDGSKTKILSDESWRMTDKGPIRRNNEFDGEEYDARMELPGWDTASYDDSTWEPVQLVAAPGGAIKSQIIEPMKITHIIHPVSVTNPASGKYIVDMGESFYGTVRLKASAPAGTTVNMVSAYSLKPDGTLKTADNRGALTKDTYIFKGQGVEIWNPRFKGQGFRHIEVTGFPGVPTVDNFEGLVIHTDVEVTGSFDSSHALINQTHAALNRGARMFLRSAPLDPDRDERQAWMGDPAKDAESEAYNFNVAAFYTKWMDDVARSQRSNGTIPDVATFWDWGEGVEWPSVFTIIPDWFAEFYGDRRLADTHYAAMKTWVLAMRKHEQPDGTLGATSYGDWCDASTMDTLNNNGSTPGNLVSSAYQYHNYRIMERIAASRGATADQLTFGTLAGNLKTAYNVRFLNTTTHVYQGDTQCAYVLALKFGLVPDNQREAVIAKLIDNILVKNNGHLSVGLIGMQWLMQTLTDIGRADVAWTIATRTTRPSWGYMFSKGSTTIWERWDGDTRDPSMNSESLLILAGNLDAWFYQTLAGIRPISAGFKTFMIKPEIVGDLTWAKAHFDSPYGRISSDWKIDSPTALSFDCAVPSNSSAVVHFPLTTLRNVIIRENGFVIWSNGAFVAGVPGISYDGADAKAVRFTVGSGTYAFSASGTPVPTPGVTVIVDNDDAGAQLTASWTRETISEPDQRFGASFAYAPSGNGSTQAVFRPNLPAAGSYRVYARWTSHANRATNTPFTIHHASGDKVISINQELNGGKWNLLGTFNFTAGTDGYVRLTNAANEYVIADAVKFEPANVAADGSESMLNDSFDVTTPTLDLNSDLTTRQTGYLAPTGWKANANNAANQSQLGNADTGNPQTLLLSATPGGVPAGEGLTVNLAPATYGKLVIRFDSRARHVNGNDNLWFSLSLTNAPLGANPNVVDAANSLGMLFRANGGTQVFRAGVSQGATASPWTSNATEPSIITVELSDTSGTGSPFAGNGSVAKLYDASNALLGTYPLAQMTGGYVHFGSHESAWEIDNLDISNVVQLPPYQSWIKSFFPSENNPAIVDPTADPDNDGFSNLAEFAIHGDPHDASDNGSDSPVEITSSEAGLILATLRGATFSQMPGGAQSATLPGHGIAYSIEGSRDLLSWDEPVIHHGASDGAPASTGLPDLDSSLWEYHTFRLEPSGDASPKAFLRAKVRTFP